MLEADLIAHLKDNVPSVAGRVQLGELPQGVPMPALVLVRIAGSTPRTLGGQRLFSRATLQLHAVGEEFYPPVLAAANEARAALDGLSGLVGDTRIESCLCEGEPADNSYIDGDKKIRQITQDFRVAFRA